MSAIFGDAALRWLARAKLVGAGRKQLRRLGTPAGAIFALFGVGLFGLWVTSVVITFVLGQGPQPRPELIEPGVRLGLAVLFVMALSGNVANRGLYLPGSEVERLFSAPLARADIVRYRLNAGLARASFGAVFLAVVGAVRLPYPLQAAIAALLAVAFVTVAGQGFALVLGYVEHRLSVRWIRRMGRIVFIALIAVVAGAFMLVAGELPDEVGRVDEVGSLPSEGLEGRASVYGPEQPTMAARILAHPIARILGAPFRPWSEIVVAPGLADALPWIGICTVLLLACYELVAKLPIDFRELVLDGSADVARRLRRMQRLGPGAAATEVSARAAARRVPWLFGHGPVGAVAWRKTASIWRRARSTILFALFVMALIVALNVGVLGNRTGESQLVGVFVTAILGVLYLCGGLRFDFREDVDRLGEIKAWPLGPTRLFGAMLLPEAFLVITLLLVAILAQIAIQRAPHLSQLGLALFLPPFVLLWLAIDNALFLKWPVRMVPGQDGALQNMGRAAVLLFVRGLALLVVFGVTAGAGSLTYFELLDARWEKLHAGVAGFALAWVCMWPPVALALFLGGRALRSFDPARDRP